MHRCKWLRSGKYKEALFCWQKGKKVKERECHLCLLASILSSLTSYESIKYPRLRKEVKP